MDWVLTDLSVDVRETEGSRGILAVEETIVPQRALSALSFDLDGLSYLAEAPLAPGDGARRRSTLGDGTRLLDVLRSAGTLVVFLPEAGRGRRAADADGSGTTLRTSSATGRQLLGAAACAEPGIRSRSALMAQARHGHEGRRPREEAARRRSRPGRPSGDSRMASGTPSRRSSSRRSPFSTILAGKYTFFEETKGGVTRARRDLRSLAKPLSAARLAVRSSTRFASSTSRTSVRSRYAGVHDRRGERLRLRAGASRR